MEKRYIQVPGDIVIVDYDGAPIPGVDRARFSNFILTRAHDEGMLTEGLAGIASSVSITQAARGKIEGQWIVLEEEDYARLVKRVKEPTAPYTKQYAPVVVPQLYPFMRAILDAPSERPAAFAAREN